MPAEHPALVMSLVEALEDDPFYRAITPDRLFRVQRGDGIGMPSLRYQIRRSGIPMPEFPAEAGRAETFNPRSFRFYKRLGFAPVESQLEPVTASEYWIMLRPPNGPIA